MSELHKIRKLSTLHRIIESCDVKAATLLNRDLVNSDVNVVTSAIGALEKLQIPIAEEKVYRIYPASSPQVKRRLLQYFRAVPQCVNPSLLMRLYNAAQTEEERGDVLKTMGALGTSSSDTLEFLRQKILYQNPSAAQRLGAMEGLGIAEDYKTLSSFVSSNIQIEPETDLVIQALRGISHQEDHESFAQLYRSLKQIVDIPTRFFTPLGKELVRALFCTYEDHHSIQQLFVQLKARLEGFCKADDEEVVSFVIGTLQELPNRDAPFIVNCVKNLILSKSGSDELQKLKENYFWMVHPRIKDNLQFKAIGSILEKVFAGIILELTERKKAMEMKHGREPKADLIEFLESFGNLSFVKTVTAYFKSNPPDETLKKVILTVVTRAQPNLNQRQKETLRGFLKLLMLDDARVRTSLAHECGKVDLSRTVNNLFKQLRFYFSIGRALMNPGISRQLQSLHRLGPVFEEYKIARTELLMTVISEPSKDSFLFAIKELMNVPRREFSQVLSKVEKLELSWLEEFKKGFITKGFIPEANLQFTVELLKKCGRITDVDWQRILLQIYKRDFGSISNEIEEWVMFLLAESGNPGSLDLFSDQIRKNNYVLSQIEVDVLFKYTLCICDHAMDEYREQLKDTIFGCLKLENDFYFTDLGYILYLLNDNEGFKILKKAFQSENPQVLLKATDYATRIQMTEVWPKVLEYVDKNDVKLNQQVVLYFKDIRAQVDQVQLMNYLLLLHENKKLAATELFANASMDENEKERLAKVFDDYRLARGNSNRTQFEAEKQMAEKTIFFIDIAGYTKKSATTDIKVLMAMLDEFGKIIMPCGEKYKGTLIKKIGDCYMYTFDTPLEAVLFSTEVQAILKARNLEETEDRKINTRIGLNTGKVFCMDNDVFGDPVNVAARMESNAPLNGIRVNSTTCLPIKSFLLTERDDIEVKGIAGHLETYRVLGIKDGVREEYLSSFGRK